MFNCKMPFEIEKIRSQINSSSIDTLNQLINELNEKTAPYRRLLIDISNKIRKLREEEIANCNHDYERFCEYHNDRYYICRKCGHEK